MQTTISDHFFEDSEFEDIFSILENLENVEEFPPLDHETRRRGRGGGGGVSEAEVEHLAGYNIIPKSNKRQKLMINTTTPATTTTTTTGEENPQGEGQQTRISHITVERNRRKQMNEHLTALRSLMPSFYVKRVSPHFPCPFQSFYNSVVRANF